MLKIDQQSLSHEVRNAMDHSRRYMGAYNALRQELHGPAFKQGGGDVDSTDDVAGGVPERPVNIAHQWTRRILPKITYNNPWVGMQSRREGSQQAVATALQAAINRWVKETDMRQLNRTIGVDFGFSWYVVMVRPEPYSGEIAREFSDPVYWPIATRISPTRFFWDPMATEKTKARFFGHVWEIDREDLVEIARKDPDTWDVDAIDALSTDGAERELLGRPKDGEIEREEVVCVSVWIPEATTDELGPNDGYHGSIVDLVVTGGVEGLDGDDEAGDMRIIGRARPYYGPRWGPYTWCGADIVPDDPAPLAPLVSAKSVIDTYQILSRREILNARAYRRLLVVDDTDDEMSETLESEPDRTIIAKIGFKKDDINEVEVGGNTQQGIAQTMMAKELVDRAIGMDDAQSGNVGGIGTATEVMEAANASSEVVDQYALVFKQGLEQVVRTVSWYLFHDDRVVMNLGSEIGDQLGMANPWYYGGDDTRPQVRKTIAKRMMDRGFDVPEPWLMGGLHKQGSGATFDDLELEIDIESMKRVNPQVRLAQAREAFTTLQSVAQIAPAAPFIDWTGAIDEIGVALGMPHLSERFDEEMFLKMIQAQQAPQKGPRSIPMLQRQIGATAPGGGQTTSTGQPRGAAAGMASGQSRGQGSSTGKQALGAMPRRPGAGGE